MTRPWRRFVAELLAPLVALWLLFVAVRDGFLLRHVTFRSRTGGETVFIGSEAVWVGLALLGGAAICAFLTYWHWFRTDGSGFD